MITALVATVLVTGAALSVDSTEGVPLAQFIRCAPVRWPGAVAEKSPGAASARWPGTMPFKWLRMTKVRWSVTKPFGLAGGRRGVVICETPARPRRIRQMDPYGSPGARTWRWPVHGVGGDVSTGGDTADPISEIHRPSPPSEPLPPHTMGSRDHSHRRRAGENADGDSAAIPGPGGHPATGSMISLPPMARTIRRGLASNPTRIASPGSSGTFSSVRRLPKAEPGAVAAIAALRRLGTPYVWGGGSAAGATRGGFDCSGLALYAWSRAGVSLPHYTGSQFTRGAKIPISRLRAGDLVFFGGGTGDPTHVGIYLKNGVMIHAPKSGDVVRKVDFLRSAYYRARYRGAIRPST